MRATGGRPPRPALRGSARRADRRDGAVGVRQVDAHAHHGRPRPADRRLRRDRRHRDHHPEGQRAHEAAAQAHRLRLPVLQPPPHAHGRGKRDPAADACRPEAGARLARGVARKRRPRGSPKTPAGGAVWRAAAARRHRAGLDLAADRALRRRADREPRLGFERRDPRARPPLRRRARTDDRDGHARPGRGDDRRPCAPPRRRRDRANAGAPDSGAGDRRDPGGGGPMTVVALKGLFARRLRAVLTALAIVLGVAMVSGSFVLTDTISKAFDSIFTSSYSHTDAVVSGQKLVDYSNGGNATVSQALLERIRQMPDVAAASGGLIDLNGDSTHATLIGRDGKAIQTNGNPTFGFGIDPSQPRFNPLKLKDGRWATGPNEVVIDAQTAKKHRFAVGDTIGVAAHGPRRSFHIVGTATYGNVESLGGATIAVFSIPTAQRLLDLDGYSEISVAAKPGVSDATLVSELKQSLPQTAQVRTAKQQADEDRKGVSSFISFIRGFLLGFGGIALFVGAFVIFNTLSITVAQRTRELATLRT